MEVSNALGATPNAATGEAVCLVHAHPWPGWAIGEGALFVPERGAGMERAPKSGWWMDAIVWGFGVGIVAAFAVGFFSGTAG